MNITYKKESFIDSEKTISYQYEKENIFVYIEIWLYNEKFQEYQKNLFSEFYSNIIDLIDKNDVFLDFKKELESKIKQFNTQLKIFQEKINIEEKIEIRWNIQIIWDNYYISSLIWESSIIIYRDNHLEVVVPNEVEEDDKIDIFSEIIEWELENKDKIISIACNIYNYLTDSEIKEFAENEDDIINSIKDVLSMRIKEEEIWFISYIKVNIEKVVIQEKKEINIEKYKDIIKRNKYAIWIIIWLWIIFFVIVSIFLYLWKNSNKAVVNIQGKQVTLDLTDIKREIDAFSKLDNKDTKLKKEKYDQIMKNLELYEKSGIQQLEIKELKKKMEQSYYKWFNINIITENDGILNKIYSLSENDIKDLENIEWLTKTKSSINIYWTKWAIIGIVNNKIKWVKQKISIPANIKTCINNLSNNGLYCLLDNNDIYNISKYGLKTITNTNWKWANNTIYLWTYGVNKLYLLTLDKKLNEKWTYIQRYVLKSKDNFQAPTNYTFSKDVDKNMLKWIFTWSTMAVDGTFLIWTKNGLLQAYNKKLTTYDARIVKWYEQWIIDKENDLRWKVKVIADKDSPFVYLYDYNTKSLIVYYSRYKNTDNARNSYQLSYLFKIKLSLNNENVVDISVDNKKLNPSAYILTDKNIYKVDLNQFRE